ncbi:zeta toxin family protein [Qipengyuania sp. DSG2-2]|uniref:zeta toxin family protein n=1 Tax=Qipengyuania sp. DGS2-2 TaxID=3349631 RepID=UPI0036D3E27E
MAIVAGRPTLFLIAGPNGAGKSTFYDTVLAPRIAAPFVNADIIQRDELGDPSPSASYRAAEIAEERRREYIGEGRSFVMETVFSHPSKLDLLRDARAAGYRIVVFHLGLQSVDLALARVAERTQEGGHPVPPEKIAARFARNGALIRDAVLMADRAQVLDASVLNDAPQLVAEFAGGQVVRVGDEMPEWAAELYGEMQ